MVTVIIKCCFMLRVEYGFQNPYNQIANSLFPDKKIQPHHHNDITAQTRSITARCRATFASCWTSLPPCRCRDSRASLRRCAHVPSRQALSYKTWRRSRSFTRIAGRRFPVTAIPFCILAVTSPVRTNMSPKCLARPRLIPKRTGRRKANPAPTRPISRCPGVSC